MTDADDAAGVAAAAVRAPVMSADEDDPILVLVCDDAEAALGHWEQLQTLAATDGGRPIKRYGAPAKSAMEAVRRASNGPDVVLIDWKMPLHDGDRTTTKIGVWMVEKITRTLGDKRPICILWSANLDECEAAAFCELGGHHAIDKATPLAEQLATLRAVAHPDPSRRSRWTPATRKVDLTRDEQLALPYIAAGWPSKTIVTALADGPRPLTEDVLSQIRSAIKKKLCEGDPRPIPVCVPEAAREAGICWTPIHYLDASQNPLDRKSGL